MKNPPKQYETLNVDFKWWTVEDEAIHRGNNYAEHMMKLLMDLKEEGMTMHGILKNAYQEGFLHGFEHKFDQTNYKEK